MSGVRDAWDSFSATMDYYATEYVGPVMCFAVTGIALLFLLGAALWIAGNAWLCARRLVTRKRESEPIE